ncbi:proline iminopeptidase-family hydrolase [Peribacillus sp. SCS-155]|uniref:proline iminopeptidase-family hydrolase n=1 Tax=Peribacillus sedimenti TaxID=3115297 RepID=UPI003906737D
MSVEEGLVTVTGGKVWYRKVTAGNETATPLLILHGGPGNNHLALRTLDELAAGRPVIYYDQLGSGYSERPTDPSLWKLERFVEELGQVRKELGLDQVHILGHSWGTTLLAAYLLAKPTGIKSAIFSSPCLSAPRWADDQTELLKDMPEDIQEIIQRCESEGTTDSEEYEEATKQYYRKHLCRLDPRPESMEQASKLGNKEIYNLMWGPSEFCVTGNLKDFDCTDRLHEISEPSLFLCGRFDEATPASAEFFSSLVPGSMFHVFEESSHCGYVEQQQEYVEVVGKFLENVEAKQ